MFSGGVIWNTNRNLAIRINRIECFSVDSDTTAAALLIHYVSSKGNLEEATIEKMGREQHEELEQFRNRFEAHFRESVAVLLLAQAKEELNLHGKNSDGLMSVFSNSVDWTKSAQ